MYTVSSVSIFRIWRSCVHIMLPPIEIKKNHPKTTFFVTNVVVVVVVVVIVVVVVVVSTLWPVTSATDGLFAASAYHTYISW